MSTRRGFVLVTVHLILQACANSASGQPLFKHCLGPADIGGLEKEGIFPNVCLKESSFENRKHTWSFWNSVILDSNFTSCVFRNEGRKVQNFLKAEWRNVKFTECVFEDVNSSGTIQFEETYFENVVFEGCTFDSSTTILFSKFSFANVEFRNCSFLSDTNLELGSVRRLRIFDSVFGSQNDLGGSRMAESGSGNILFSKMFVQSIQMSNSTSYGEMRFQDAIVSKLDILDSNLNVLACHEPIISGKDAKDKSTLNDTFISESVFMDGIYCDQTTFNGIEIHNISVQYAVDLRDSDIQRMAVLGVNALTPEDTCSTFDLSSSQVRGKKLSGLNTTKTKFVSTVFAEHIVLDGIKLKESLIDVQNAIFSSEKINDECCTESCVAKGCKCNVPIDSKVCPVGDPSVNINIGDSCFPGNSTLSVVNSMGQPIAVLAQDLRHGDRALTSAHSAPSEVFFFGHKSPSQAALYLVITATSKLSSSTPNTRTLRLSPGHLLPVIGRGLIAARKILKGDVLKTIEDDEAVVRSVKHEILMGMYAPTTFTGTIAVDGIQVSCYTDTVPPAIAHILLAPLRAVYRMGQHGRGLVMRFSFLHEKSGSWAAGGASV